MVRRQWGKSIHKLPELKAVKKGVAKGKGITEKGKMNPRSGEMRGENI